MLKRRGSVIGVLLVAMIVSQSLLQISALSGVQSSLDPDLDRESRIQEDEQASCGCKRKPSDMSVRTFLTVSEPLIVGPIHDCCCTAETVESVNEKILPILDRIVETPFFRYYKMANEVRNQLNLWRDCSLFPDDGQCASRSCAVDECEEEEFQNACLGHESGNIDASLDGHNFQKWLEDGDPWTNDADVMNVGEHMNYVDLMKNPERFTGYAGPSATRIWKAIYDENCFVNEDADLAVPSFNMAHEQCIEKRVFYRLISGLHSSITTHLTYEFSHDLSNQVFAPNIIRFYETVGKYPMRVHNMYLTYLMLLRAVSKALPTFYNFDFKSDQASQIQELLHELSQVTTTCPNTFDENVMFQGNDAITLKSQFKNHFRNISVILDCVACERCKLWGKLQINGLGTALKILFDAKQHPEDQPLNLERTELVALIHTLRRLSESLTWSNTMFKEYTSQQALKHNTRTLDASEIFGGEKGFDLDAPHATPDTDTPHQAQADEHLIPLEESQVNEDPHIHAQQENQHINDEMYAIPPPIPTTNEEQQLDGYNIGFDAPESQKETQISENLNPSELDHSTRAVSSTGLDEDGGSNRRTEMPKTHGETFHGRPHHPHESAPTLEVASTPSEANPSSQESLNQAEAQENARRTKQDPTHSETIHSRPPSPDTVHILPVFEGEPIDDQLSHASDDSTGHATHPPVQSRPPPGTVRILPIFEDEPTGVPVDQEIHHHAQVEAQNHEHIENHEIDDSVAQTAPSHVPEGHGAHQDHSHHDHEHHHETNHHQEAHSHQHHHGNHHGHGHGHGSHGMMGMQFGGDPMGMGDGHHHGGHEIPSETRDLSSISSDSWSPPDLEGFDMVLAYAVEYWRVAKHTASDFYLGVLVPTLRENSSWYSGLAILAPVFLLFILALRRQPHAFVPFEEPIYSAAQNKGTVKPKGSQSGASRGSQGPSSDQSFAPAPGFVNPAPHPSGPEPLDMSGQNAKNAKNAVRKPSQPTTTPLSNNKSTPMPPSKGSPGPSPTRNTQRAPAHHPPTGAIAPLVPLSTSTTHAPEAKPSRGGIRETQPKNDSNSLSTAAPSSDVSPPHSAASSSTTQAAPSLGGFPMPSPGMRSTANAPKMIAPKPRRAIPVPMAAKK